jgi:hypothetical protein
MSTYIVGFRPPNAQWEKMRDIWKACDAAGVELPEEVIKFFGYEDPDPAGVTVNLDKSPAVRSLGDGSGFEVDITQLPKDLTILRFVNSW